MSETVVVRGLDDLVRSFGRLQPELRKSIQSELRGIAREVADTAREIARAKGLVASGALVRGITPSVRGGRAFVRETTTRDGFPYPRLYEFARHRAFLNPALEQEAPNVERRLGEMLDRLSESEGF